ncbi:hypothetical protein [uncultured Pontibacter sp.]|uniref:hypothetical protein n=1 Tax=uncultured Pontibacter sp. TaxID=453356 RepID=UPI002604ECBD|nr:hypothetical protein [uncultured Pontibacter sp.]
MNKLHTICFLLLMISCNVKESENGSVAQPQESTSFPAVEPTHSGKQPLFTKEDIKGVWTAGESENASFSIEQDSILFVDTFEYLKYEFKNDTLTYLESGDLFFRTRVIKADKDSLVTSNEDGIRRFWRFKD